MEVEDGSVAVVDHVELDQTKGMFFFINISLKNLNIFFLLLNIVIEGIQDKP